MAAITRDAVRQRIFAELSYRETMLAGLRMPLREDAAQPSAAEVAAWAAKAEETTQAIDMLVGAAYEYLLSDWNAYAPEPIPPPTVAAAAARSKARDYSVGDDEPPF
jgi:hypothetical protein